MYINICVDIGMRNTAFLIGSFFYEFENIVIYNMIPIGSRIFTFLIGRFCEKIPYFMKNSYKQLVNV